MLPRTQTAWFWVPRRLQWQACRSNSTTASAKQYRQAEEGSASTTGRHQLPMLRTPKQSALVRTGRFLESPVQAYAVIRAVERKYGAINEFYVAKDFEMDTRYQSIIHLQFKDPESFDRVPTDEGEVFQVAAPEGLNRPGGVGLDELELLLERQEYVGEETSLPAFGNVMDNVIQTGRDETKGLRVMECKIARSINPFWTPSSSSSPMINARDLTGRNFIKWGGFQTLKPIKQDTLIPDEELFGPTKIDHVRMRRTLRKWSALSGSPNPYEYSEKLGAVPQDQKATSTSTQHGEAQKVRQEGQSDLSTWEPLPGYESEADDALFSNVLLENSTQAPLTNNTIPPAAPPTRAPPIGTSEMLPLPQSIGNIRNEDISDLLTSPQIQISNPPETLLPSTARLTNKIEARSFQTEKAAQLKAARTAANLSKPSFKKPQPKPPVKGPPPLLKRNRPTSPVVVEKKDEGVTAKLKGLFGF